MKKVFTLCWCALAITAVLAAHPRVSCAAGWEDTLKALGEFDTIRDGVQESGTVYSARYEYTVTNLDGTPNNFGAGDVVRLHLTSRYTSQSLEFVGTRDELNSWADSHSSEIYAILFMGNMERAAAGQSNVGSLSSQGVRRMFDALSTDVRLSAQYDFFRVGPAKIAMTGPSGMISYLSLGESGRHAVGIEIPFRYLTGDDKVGTSLMYLTLSPFYEYSITGGANRFTATAGANVSATSVESAFFGGKTAYFDYGIMFGAAAGRTLARRLEGRVGIAYQYLERYVPESLVPDDFAWLGRTLNDAGAEQTITPAVGLTAWLAPETASLDLNGYYVYQLGSDVPDEFKSQTVVNGFVTFTPGHWQIKLGYSTSFGLKDFTDRSVVVSLRYLW